MAQYQVEESVEVNLNRLEDSFENIKCSDEAFIKGYDAIFVSLLDVEKTLLQRRERGDVLEKSGLIKVKGGDGKYLWVSPVAAQAYKDHGYEEAKRLFKEVANFREEQENYLKNSSGSTVAVSGHADQCCLIC